MKRKCRRAVIVARRHSFCGHFPLRKNLPSIHHHHGAGWALTFYELDNVILTPHNAGYTGRDRFFPFLLDEFHRFFNGETMQSEISRKRFLTMTNERLVQ